MKLTREEQQMLDGKKGSAVQKSMELLVAVGECYDAERMIPVSSVHLVSPSPINAGKGGTRFIKDMAEKGGKFVVPTTTNPACLDPWAWRELGFTEEIYREQMSLSEAVARMGAYMCNSCTPYLIGHTPRKGEHVAWGESSAVIYANSVLGSRTNREGGPTGLAAALTGRIPAYGYHLDENRRGTLKFVVNMALKGDTEYGILGYYAGKIAQDRVPVFVGIPPSISQYEMMYLGGALATTGSVTHFHVVGVTPEAPTERAATGSKKIGPSDTFEFGPAEFKKTEESLPRANPADINLVVLGCPFDSIEQIRNHAMALSGKKIKSNVDFWILTTHIVKQYAEDVRSARIIDSAGAQPLSNTCPGPMPRDFFRKHGYNVVATDSPKLSYYLPTLQGASTFCGSLDQILDAVAIKR